MEQKTTITNPNTVMLGMEHLFTVCHSDTQQYSDSVAQITAHMSKLIPRFDRVILLLAVKKEHSTDIIPCTNDCSNGKCSETKCIEKTAAALRTVVEPMLPTLGVKTKRHLLTLAKEVPHLSDVFMEFHGKIICEN